MRGDADLGVWRDFFDGSVSLPVRVDEYTESGDAGEETFFLWRPKPLPIGMSSDDARFIDGDPKDNFITECLDDFLGVALEIKWELFAFEATLGLEPDRVRPMPERDEWCNVTGFEGE